MKQEQSKRKSATSDIEAGRIMPQAREIEEAVLSAVMLEKTAFETANNILTPDMFYDKSHELIFSAFTELEAERKPIDILTVVERLRKTGNMEVCGGASYIAQLSQKVVSSVHLDFHCLVVKDKYIARRMIEVCSKSVALGFDETEEIDETIANLNAEIEHLQEDIVGKHETNHVSGPARNSIRQMHLRIKNRKEGIMPGITTGFAELDRVTNGWQPEKFVVFAARPGTGKEQPLTSKVLTTDGFRFMSDIKPGSYVIGGNGIKCQVIGTFPQGIKPVYKVHFSDGTFAECGLEHVWTVMNMSSRNKKWNNLTLKQLLGRKLFNDRKSRKLSGRKPTYNYIIPMVKVDYKPKEYEINPYVLGVLIGDGSLTGKSICSFSCPDFDSDISEKVSCLLPVNYELKKDTFTNCPRYIIRQIKQKKGFSFIRKIEDLGLNVKSKEKFIPESYMLGSYNQRLELLRGLMDTDGSCANNGSISFSTISERLAKDLISLVQSLGGIAKYSIYDRTKDGKGFEYEVRISIEDCPFSALRKVANTTERKAFMPRRYITSIEYVRNEECKCILVSNKNGLYVTDNYIVTHNTSIAIHLAKRAAKRGTPVAFFSLEMGETELTDRMIISEADINADNYNSGAIEPQEWSRAETAMTAISKLPVYIDANPKATVGNIVNKARLLKKQGKCKMAIIDYLNLITPSAKAGRSREQEVSEISRLLKVHAKELKIPFIVLCQMNRDIESEKREPRLSDLRESGSIEQDADMVIFINRPGMYVEELRDKKTGELLENCIELIVKKHRGGKLGKVRIKHNENMTTFYDWDYSGISQFTQIQQPAREIKNFYEKEENIPF